MSYLLIPKTSHAVTEVATGTSVKTVLQLATSATVDVKILGWGISFDGISASAEPGQATLVVVDVNVGGGLTAQVPELYSSDRLAASSLTTNTGYGSSSEGTITASRILDSQEIHPQTGYSVWWYDKGPIVGFSKFIRIRTAVPTTSVNCIPWICYEEPAS